MTLVDTADIYAPEGYGYGHNELARRRGGAQLDAAGATPSSSSRRSASPATVVDGEDVWGRDGSRDHLLRAAEASVERLGLVPDVILLHRLNREQQPFATTVENMLAVREAGLRAARSASATCTSTSARSPGTSAAARSPGSRTSAARATATTPTSCTGRRAHGVAYFPWSPLGGGDDARRLGELHPEFAASRARSPTSRVGR